jgi:phosphoribosylaminoimidazole-succinocarboxamide synthase
MTKTVYETHVDTLPLLHRGKVRDIYQVDDAHLLIVATDRLSAFDVVLPTPIPEKGILLTRVSNFWFSLMSDIIPNHLTDYPLEKAIPDSDLRATLQDRSVIVKRLKALPIEAIVRGYLAGSGWKDYQQTGAVCGVALPDGLTQATRLPHPIYTPSSKAEVGTHDENIDFAHTVALVGESLAVQIKQVSLAIYQRAQAYASTRGIIIADTKFEFGIDESGQLFLMDELLTPDSSRFWPVESYAEGISPPSFDKQFVRDYLETLDWDKKAPGPILPNEVLEKTAAKYREAQVRLCQSWY